MPILPRHDLVLVRIDRYQDYRTPVSGVIVPSEAQIDNVTGVVEAVGPDVAGYCAGDSVLFAAPMGTEIAELHAPKYRLIPQHALLGTYIPESV